MSSRRTKTPSKLVLLAVPALFVLALTSPVLASEGGSGSPAEWNWTDLGYGDKDAHGGELDPGEEKMPPPALFALINFAIFAGILLWKAAPAIKRFVKQRHITIKEALEESARLREEARRKLAEYSEKIAGVNAEVDALIAGIRADAEAERQRIIAEAEAQAAALQRDAEERIAADLQRARRELEREVVAVAIAAAEKLIRDKATPSDQHKLVDGFITELTSSDKKPTTPQERA